jgi:predicted nucleic acid-binding protein
VIAYVDTSVVLRVLFRLRGALRSWDDWTEVYASEILKLEARRVIDRLRLETALDDEGVALAHEALVEMEGAISFVGLTSQVLARASAPMPTVVKTPDAVHVASALMLREGLDDSPVFVSHDRQQTTAARALGFQCRG